MIPYAPALAKTAPRTPDSWQDMPCGEQLKQRVESELAPLSRQWFGYQLLKLGALGAELALPQCPISQHRAITHRAHPYASLVADYTHLPLQRRSIDTVVLPFTLDFASDPHKVLREASRAIVSDGHLVVVGLNPLSCAGMARFWPARRQSLLHDMRAFSTFRMRDWFELLGYEVTEHRSIIHNELLFDRPMHHWRRYQRWLTHYLPGLASVYIMVGKKRRLPMTPTHVKLKPKPAFSASGAGLSAG